MNTPCIHRQSRNLRSRAFTLMFLWGIAVVLAEARETCAMTTLQDAVENAETPPAVSSDGPESQRTAEEKLAIPIPPNANEQAYRRELTTIGLMFVMGIGCTILAFLAVWILLRTGRPPEAPDEQVDP